MKGRRFIIPLLLTFILSLSVETRGETMKTLEMSRPKTKGAISVEEAIHKRRSVRAFITKEITMDDISQLLWACQGITGSGDRRASPSAGALYPLEIYLVKNDGLYHYIPRGHKIEKILDEDIRRQLADAAYGQGFVAEAPIDIIICAVYERVMSRYNERGIRYTDMEAGHAAQNVFLQAVALGLDSVAVGAFGDVAVAKIMRLPAGVKPLYILPVGYKR